MSVYMATSTAAGGVAGGQGPPKTITVTRRSVATACNFIRDETGATDAEVGALVEGITKLPSGWGVTRSCDGVQWMWDLTNPGRVRITVFKGGRGEGRDG